MRLYAIDVNGVSHWLWHSTMTDEQGNELDLAAKVTRWWEEFSETLKPTHVVACFDGRDNWRKKEWVEYKSTRLAKPVDEAKVAALKQMPALWASFGVRCETHDTFEADDVIASIAARFEDEAEIVTVVTDKDLMQIVGDNVKQYDPRPNKAGECVFYDAKMVEEKLGVPPHRVPELLAMMGDSSDDVPGVDGIGRVQAINAIKQTKTANEIFRKAAKHELQAITTKNQDKLVAGRADFDLSLRLVTLRYDVPVTLTLEDCEIEHHDEMDETRKAALNMGAP